MPRDKVAALVNMPVDELRALVDKHGSVLGVERNGVPYIDPLALDRIMQGLPPEHQSTLSLAVLWQQMIDAFLTGRGSAFDRMDRLLLEAANVRRFQEIGCILGVNDDPDNEHSLDPLLRWRKSAYDAAAIVKMQAIRDRLTAVIDSLNTGKATRAVEQSIELQKTVDMWIEELTGRCAFPSDPAWEATKRLADFRREIHGRIMAEVFEGPRT